jgi:rubredoxin
MTSLIKDHVFARKTVGNLLEARQMFAQGETNAIEKIIMTLEELAVFYPKHIVKEDQSFFHPVMDYFNRKERENMVREFHEFDQNLFQERYREIAERSLRLKRTDLTKWKCTVCDYVYDPAKGDAEHGVQSGISFNDLPVDWKCPICLAEKTAFKETN